MSTYPPSHVVSAPHAGHLGEAQEKDFDVESTPSQTKYDVEKGENDMGGRLENTVSVQEGALHAGQQKFKNLSWTKLTVCLIVEAIALGSLSVPSAFAAVGMGAGIVLSIGLGLVAIYTSYVVGQVKLKYMHVKDYADAVKLIWGKPGYTLGAIMFCMLLILIVGSHTLTGTIAWIRIVNSPGTCALVWGILSAILLFVLALPPSFAEFAILGYIDFVSIILAIGIVIISTGIEAHQAPGGLSAVDWTWGPPPNMSLSKAFLAVTNIIFAYSFAVCQFSFMDEMHTPRDYVKSIWALGLIEIFIYTVTGGLIYAFVGADVASPALLSSGRLMSRIAFGVALPVIFISGSINSCVVGRYMIQQYFPESNAIRYTNTKMGWIVWIVLLAVITLIAFVIAEAIPFFNALLGLISALFISGFTFYFPSLFWFQLIKQGKWNATRKNILLSVINVLVLIIGIATLGLGTYASVVDILDAYKDGSVRGSFTCSASAYDS